MQNNAQKAALSSCLVQYTVSMLHCILSHPALDDAVCVYSAPIHSPIHIHLVHLHTCTIRVLPIENTQHSTRGPNASIRILIYLLKSIDRVEDAWQWQTVNSTGHAAATILTNRPIYHFVHFHLSQQYIQTDSSVITQSPGANISYNLVP